MDCFVTLITRAGERWLMIRSISGDIIEALAWGKDSYSEPVTLSLDAVLEGSLEITHFYGYHELRYTSSTRFLTDYFSRAGRVRVRGRRFLGHILQWLFNRRSIRSRRRLAILRIFVQARLDHPDHRLTAFDVANRLYSVRWTFHPRWHEIKGALQYQIDSLAEAGDLEKTGIQYLATGKALVTLEDAELEDRRHRENATLQIGILILTLVIAASTAVSAGLKPGSIWNRLVGFLSRIGR